MKKNTYIASMVLFILFSQFLTVNAVNVNAKNYFESTENMPILLALSDYTLTYDGNGNTGGTVPESSGDSYDSGSEVPISANSGNLTKTGYVLTSWNTSPDGQGTEYLIDGSDTISSILENITLYAHWIPLDITVSFDPNGSVVSPSTMNVTYDAIYGGLPTPTKTGYEFNGWFTKQSSLINSDSFVTNERMHTLYARWSPLTVTVNFDSNGGDAVTPSFKIVTFDATYGELQIPTRAGYTFDGWFTEQSGGTLINSDSPVTITITHTLYAKWTPLNITVNFDSNSGNDVSFSKAVTFGTTYGELPIPTRAGYIFNGWFTAQSGGTSISFDSPMNNAIAHTLYAQWVPLNNIIVNFNSNGGNVISPLNAIFNAPYGILPEPTRIGYTFDGWFTDQSDGDLVDVTTLVSNENNHVLYAKWLPLNNIAVNFDSNGGNDVSPSFKTVTFDAFYGELPTTTRTGYNFNGWFTKQSGGTLINSDSYVTSAIAHTLYAKWLPLDNIAVNFNSNGGNTVTPSFKIVTFDAPYGDLPTVTRTGYNFNGWATDESGETLINPDSYVTSAIAHTLYAKWLPLDNITVNFNSNGGNEISPLNVTFDSPYGVLPEPTKTGYAFSGWFTEQSGGILINSDSYVTSAIMHILYAKWTPLNITVGFDSNGGDAVTPSFKAVVFDAPYGDLPTPTKTGYVFTGWLMKQSGGTLINPDSPVTTAITHTLYAQWSPLNITVNFDSNNGDVVTPSYKIVTFDATYGELQIPTRNGYTFDGWFTKQSGGNLVNSNSPVNNAIMHTLYAKWTPLNVTVNFDSNSGNDVPPSSKYVTFDTIYGELPKPAKTGYIFNGWFTAQSGGAFISADSPVVSSIEHTLYAQWVPLNNITVNFNSNGGNNVSPLNVTFDAPYGILPKPARIGYTFNGWFTDQIDGTLVDINTLVSDESDHTLYAQWTPLDNITVNFNSNGGNEVSPLNVTFGSTYGVLPIPTRTGYTFNGWFTAEADGTLVDVNSFVINSIDHTLYAHWSMISESLLPILNVVPNITVNKGSTFDPKTLILEAKDIKDGINAIDQVIVEGNVDTSIVGVKSISFSLTNSYTNTITVTSIVTVIDAHDFSAATYNDLLNFTIANNLPKTEDNCLNIFLKDLTFLLFIKIA